MSIDEIRARCSADITEMVANPSEYYRSQVIIRDRTALLAAYDALAAELAERTETALSLTNGFDGLRTRIAALEATLRSMVNAWEPDEGGSDYRLWAFAKSILPGTPETPAQSGSGACKACGYFQGAHSHCLNPDCPSKIKGNDNV